MGSAKRAMLQRARDYETLCRDFRWQVPERYNIAVDVADRQDASATAIIHVDEAGRTEALSFGDLSRASQRLANVFEAAGLARGDRVGILLPQRPETAIAHLACYRAGLVAVPLFTLFGPEALGFRLADSGARALITDEDNLPKIAELRGRLSALDLVLSADRSADGNEARSLPAAMAAARDSHRALDTAADDPALIIYTSGTEGPPKGALHAHRVLLGHLPGVEFPQAFFPQLGDRFWTPADWAWIGGLLDVLLPSLHHGVPVVAHRMRKFEPEAAYRLMAEHGIRNAFLPPTALKMLRQAPAKAAEGVALRSVGSGGETLGAELLDWGRSVLGVDINEFYGQTECNLVVGNNAEILPVRPGSMGRPVPGHRVAVLDEAGRELGPEEEGWIGVRRPDPVMFLGYWNNPKATEAKFLGEWLLTGDRGRQDADGYLHYVGRSDDVITTAGYRVGPGEVEDCLMGHPAVAMAAVIGVPDPERTQRIKAFLVLKPGLAGGEGLKEGIRQFVRERLAAHEYPRDIAFVDGLPLTATGKIRRGELRSNPPSEVSPEADDDDFDFREPG